MKRRIAAVLVVATVGAGGYAYLGLRNSTTTIFILPQPGSSRSGPRDNRAELPLKSPYVNESPASRVLQPERFSEP